MPMHLILRSVIECQPSERAVSAVSDVKSCSVCKFYISQFYAPSTAPGRLGRHRVERYTLAQCMTRCACGISSGRGKDNAAAALSPAATKFSFVQYLVLWGRKTMSRKYVYVARVEPMTPRLLQGAPAVLDQGAGGSTAHGTGSSTRPWVQSARWQAQGCGWSRRLSGREHTSWGVRTARYSVSFSPSAASCTSFPTP